jgi:hypothetical protein
MISKIKRKTSLAFFVMLSLAGHLAGGYLTGLITPFNLRAPVTLPSVISVNLEPASADPAATLATDKHLPERQHNLAALPGADKENKNIQDSEPPNINQGEDIQVDGEQTVEPVRQFQKASSETPVRSKTPAVPKENNTADNVDYSSVPLPSPKEMDKRPVWNGGEFVPSAEEKLSYRIMLYGIPAGTAVIDATNRNGEVRITTRVYSNEAFSSIYPVDIFVDTRLMVGNYLLTRIRQHEGSNTGDTGFTLMLREKNAFWVDRLNKRYSNIPLPSEDVMDMLSGFYYLRNRKLEVGKPVLLHLFDSSRYVPTTVEVLRKEHLRLPALREVDTLVVHPVLETDGFFHTSGDIFIWLTDDEKKVPVKMEAEIPLGKVTAELVGAESETSAEPDTRGLAGK